MAPASNPQDGAPTGRRRRVPGPMRVRVSYTVEVDDDTRRAINQHYGRPGLATRQQVRDWYWLHGHSMDDDLAAAWEGDDPGDDDDDRV